MPTKKVSSTAKELPKHLKGKWGWSRYIRLDGRGTPQSLTPVRFSTVNSSSEEAIWAIID